MESIDINPGIISAIGGISFIFAFLFIVSLWRIFSKAGQAGWKSLIPIYNAYIFWKIAGKSFFTFFFVYIFLFIIGYVLLLWSTFDQSSLSLPTMIVGFIFTFGAIIYAIVSVAGLCDGLSIHFGHGMPFAIGLFFLPWLFLLILAFNKDRYVKPRESVLDEF